MKGLSLVIPAHNSEKVICSSIMAYSNAFSSLFSNFELIVVCNDCSDKTFELCLNLANQFPIKVINITQRGKGHALITGLNNARFDILGFLDADNPFELEKIKEMLNLLKFYEVIIASKYKKGRARFQDSQLRRLISLGGGLFSRILFGLNVSDSQAGAKFFKKEVWEKIKRGFLCKGFDFDIELLYKIKKLNFKIKEVQIPFKYEKFSTFRLKYLPGMIKRLLKLRFLK